MQDKELSKKVLSGMKWKSLERLFIQIMNAVTPIVLARILTPEDFGAIAILTVFISLANTFVNNGLCTSIIQKKNSDNLDCSTVFYTQFLIAVVCYVIIFASAPLVGKFYKNMSLVPMIRVMSVSVIIGSFTSMQTTVLKKNMQFGKSFISHILATIMYGAVGIILAYNGFGCWSLVWANIANTTILALSSTLVVRWWPDWAFSFKRLKSLFSYSWKLTVGWLIGTIHQDLYTLVIGKKFSSATLGYYNRAGSFPQIINKTVTEVVDGVMFPALSKIQDDPQRLKTTGRTLISTNAYVLFAVFFGLSAVSENLIIVLLTAKWLPAVPMMRIVCITYALNAINNSNMHIFTSMGRSDIFMKFEMIKRTISILLLIIMSFINIYAVIIVLLLMAVLSNCMNAYQNSKLLNYSYREFAADMLPSFIMSLIMAVIVYFIGKLNLLPIITLIIQIAGGVGVYLVLSFIIKPKGFCVAVAALKKTVFGKKTNTADN